MNTSNARPRDAVSPAAVMEESPLALLHLPDDAPQPYRQFWELWRAERFYECHEVLEDLWRETRGPQRWFYNGLINCAVALYQQRRGNEVGAARQLLRAQVKLRRFRPRHYGADVNELLAEVARAVAGCLDNLSDAQRAQLPSLEKSLEARIARDFPEEFFEHGHRKVAGS